MSATEAPARGIEVCNTLEVRGTTLVVNVNKRDGSFTYKPTVTIPLEHVIGVEADPEIERTMWRAWAFGRHGWWRSRICGPDGEYRVPDPRVRFYNPRHSCADKAVVIRLQDEACERLVVEVEDPEGAVERINRAVEANPAARAWGAGPGPRARTTSKGEGNPSARVLLLRPSRRGGGSPSGVEGRPHRGATVP